MTWQDRPAWRQDAVKPIAMETKIIRDEELRNQILGEVKAEIEAIQKKKQPLPGVAFVGFIGVPLAKYNVPFHLKMAEDLGFQVFSHILPDESTESEVLDVIGALNRDAEIHAVVLLQPLPVHLSPVRIMNAIDPAKEMEGFHPQNAVGILMPAIRYNQYPMCLPTALQEIFRHNLIQPQAGQEWVLVLDDEFYQNQLVNMVTRTAFTTAVPADAVLTIVNSASERVSVCCQRADFLVVVTKHPELVHPEWLKPGVFIIDIYANLVREVPSKNDPEKLVPIIRGGVNVESVQGIAGGIIPIPGGLMGIVLAVLFRNIVTAYKNA